MNMQLLVGTRKGLFVLSRDARGAIPWRISATAFLGVPVSMLLPVARSARLHVALDHGHFGVKLQRSDDRGKTWRETPAPRYPEQPAGEVDLDPYRNEPIPWKLKLIWSLEQGAPQTESLWCGTMPGGVFYSDDAGQHWDLVRGLWDHPLRKQWMGGGADLPGVHSIVVDPRDACRVLVAVSVGGVWETRDAGSSWAPRAEGMWAAYVPPEVNREPQHQDVHRMVSCRDQPDTLWAQHHNAVFRSTDGGASWQEIDAIEPTPFGFTVAVHPRDPNQAWFVPATKDELRYAANASVVVSRTRDGGASFEQLRDGLPQHHAYDLVYRHALDVDGSGEVLAFGSTTGTLWLSEDQGDHWWEISAHLPPVYCLRFADWGQ